MGQPRWSETDWDAYAATAATKTTSQIYTSTQMNPELDPKTIQIRESRDSVLNPRSTPIIVGLDVTGSMGIIADTISRVGLGTLVAEILARQPVSDPHIMFMGIGDAWYDQAPLQATQFEADIRIAEQLERVWLEKRGGNNQHESYHLPWWFAVNRTSTDAWERRQEKGWLITVGDEEAPPTLLRQHAKKIFGADIERDIPVEELAAEARKRWNLRHIVVEQGNYARYHLHEAVTSWQKVLGQDVILLNDYNKIAEVIVAVIQTGMGADPEDVLASWPAEAAPAISHALGLTPRGVARFR